MLTSDGTLEIHRTHECRVVDSSGSEAGEAGVELALKLAQMIRDTHHLADDANERARRALSPNHDHEEDRGKDTEDPDRETVVEMHDVATAIVV